MNQFGILCPCKQKPVKDQVMLKMPVDILPCIKAQMWPIKPLQEESPNRSSSIPPIVRAANIISNKDIF